MMNKTIPRLPDAELEVMKVIWKEPSPISTSQIKEVLDRIKEWNVSTLQTLLNRLIQRKFLHSYKEGKYRYYTILITEEEYLAVENKSFFEKVNSKSILKMVNSLYETNSITDEDLMELERFIAKKKGEIK